MKNIRFVFTGGGTGGHVYPNIAIYEALKKKYPDAECLYIGTARGSEAQIVRSIPQPLEFAAIHSRGLPQSLKSPATLPALFSMFWGTLESYRLLRRFRPQLVIGSGGYVSAPVLLAAALLRIKILIHEQNAVPGRLNQFIARFATRIAVSFPSTQAFFPAVKTTCTGYPLRHSLLAPAAEAIRQKWQIPQGHKVLFIFSGSTGARTINQAAVEILPQLLARPGLTVILATGKSFSREYKAYEETIQRLQAAEIPPDIASRLIVREYFDHIEEIYAITDLVVARAGAGSIKELSALGLPAILIPKSDLPADHQILNAKEMERSGGARLILEETAQREGQRQTRVPERLLFEAICQLLEDEQQLARMKSSLQAAARAPRATDQIIKEIETILKKKEKPEEKRITIRFLHSADEDKTYELLFPNTTIGNTLLADVYLEGLRGDTLFDITFLPTEAEEERIIIRRRRGGLRLNGEAVTTRAEIHDGDVLQAEERSLQLQSYVEKVRLVDEYKTAAPQTFGYSLSRLLSRLGGFFRELIAAALFGAGRAMDIFSAALTIATYLRRIVAENALENVFLPIYQRLFDRSPRKRAWQAAASIGNFNLLLSLLLAVGGILATPPIILTLFPGLVRRGLALETIRMTRLLFPSLVLAAGAAMMAALLKAHAHLRLAENSAVVNSLATMAGIVIFLPLAGMYSLAYGVLLGGLLQLAFLAPFLIRLLARPVLEFSYRPVIRPGQPAFKKYGIQLVPIGTDVLLSQTANVADKVFAAGLAAGSLSFLYFALEVFRLPFAFISRAIGSVVLKGYSEHTALFDKERTKKTYLEGVSVNLFLLTPLTILLIVLAQPLVSLLLERGRFDAHAVTNTALALQFYAIGMVGWGIQALTRRLFAARLDVRTPLRLNLAMLLVHIGLCFILVRTPLQFAGIALATSLTYLLFSLIRLLVLQRHLAGDGIRVSTQEIFAPLGKTVAASLLMLFFLIQARFVFNRIFFASRLVENLILTVSLSCIGMAVYFLTSLVLKNTGILIFRKRSEPRIRHLPTALLSPFQFWERASRHPETYRNEFRYKIDLYLAHPNWQIRNIGIKLIGLFRDESKRDQLLELLRSGQVRGFARRNALHALCQIGIWNEEIQDLLSRLLADGYYEVRVAAIQYLTQHLPAAEYSHFQEALQRRFRTAGQEEKLALLQFIAAKGQMADLPLLDSCYLESNTLIREQLLETLQSYSRRGLLTAAELHRHVGRVLITSNHLTAEFRIRSLISRLLKESEKP